LAPDKAGDSRQIYDLKDVRNSKKYNDIDEIHREYGEEVKQSIVPNHIEKRDVNLFLPEFECLPGGQPI
jgi:hypothetical protein